MSQFADIIERLEKATGPDRTLDARVYVACGLGHIEEEHGNHFTLKRADGRRTLHVFTGDVRGPYQSEEPEDVSGMVGWDVFTAPPYTASLDAATALVERMLPGWHLALVTYRGHDKFEAVAEIGPSEWPGEMPPDNIIADGASLAIALLIAMFRALEAQEPAHEKA